MGEWREGNPEQMGGSGARDGGERERRSEGTGVKAERRD